MPKLRYRAHKRTASNAKYIRPSDLSPNEKALLEALKGRLCIETNIHDFLRQEARSHARFMAKHGNLGHAYWTNRCNRLIKFAGRREYREVAAHSPAESLEEACNEIVTYWELYPRALTILHKPHKVIGYGVARSTERDPATDAFIPGWYACIIVGD